MPKSKLHEELEKRHEENPFSCIEEFEKNKLRSIFKSFDPKKEAKIPIEKLNEFYE